MFYNFLNTKFLSKFNVKSQSRLITGSENGKKDKSLHNMQILIVYNHNCTSEFQYI